MKRDLIQTFPKTTFRWVSNLYPEATQILSQFVLYISVNPSCFPLFHSAKKTPKSLFWTVNKIDTPATFNRTLGSFLFIRREDSIMVSKQTMLIFPIELTLFWAFHTSWTIKLLLNHMFVSMWSCHSVILSLWPFFYLLSFLCVNTLQLALILVQMFLNAVPRKVFFLVFHFLRLLFTFLVFWDLAKFLRWNLDHFQIKFVMVLCGKLTILRVFY